MSVLLTMLLTITVSPRAASAQANGGGDALQELMGEFDFGMTHAQVLRKVTEQIHKRYDSKIFATSDVYQQDKLRRERDQEIERIGDSYQEFKGETTGWDVSVIDDQFVHETGESMLNYWEPLKNRNERRFFFFVDDRLYKMVVTIDASTIEKSRRKFDVFRPVLEGRYGTGREHENGLVWMKRGLMVIAFDKLTQFDAICLIIADPVASRKVIKLRSERKPKVVRKNPIIETMLDDHRDIDLDQGADVIDSILSEKRRRNRNNRQSPR